jgi:hypothetical protein
LTITKYRRVRFEIAWGRSVDITKELSKEQIEGINRIVEKLGKRKIPTGSLDDTELLDLITKYPPNLFHQELALLSLNHEHVKWPAAYPTKLHLSKEGRVTAFREIHIKRPELIELIHNQYGMLPGT